MTTSIFFWFFLKKYAKSILSFFAIFFHKKKSIKVFNLLEFFFIKYSFIYKAFKNQNIFIEKNYIFYIKNKILKQILKFLIFKNQQYLMALLNYKYLDLTFKKISILSVEILSSNPLTFFEKRVLVKKLKQLINVENLILINIKDSRIIEGFSIRINLKYINYTMINRIFNFNKLISKIRYIIK
uniref:ATP synthase CF1 delta subunit n=1 Tax=Nitzschia sp. PL1-4 TaxID=2083272 RepID=A0A2Z5ZB04_9STRA|nr:ATP synthase CF1 delta subunit [Nitzschia sp. PL1-4]